MQHPQLSTDALQRLLLTELEENWQEVDALICQQEQAAARTAIVRDMRPKRYLWTRLLRYADSLYRLCKINYEY